MFQYGHVAYQKLRNDKSFLVMCLFFLQVEQFLRYCTICDSNSCKGVTPLQAVFAIFSPIRLTTLKTQHQARISYLIWLPSQRLVRTLTMKLMKLYMISKQNVIDLSFILTYSTDCPPKYIFLSPMHLSQNIKRKLLLKQNTYNNTYLT